MTGKRNMTDNKKKLLVYILLIVITLAVYWQVHQFDFVFDDDVYITNNLNIQSGFTSNEISWAFSTKYTGLWNPLVWISFMLDYQLYGLNAGGYHVTNLIFHILSTLLLFGLFHRMTGELWKSAFVAAFFALHPLHVESVAWVSERKDVLSAFFWMATLYLYVYYTEKPAVRRYLLVLCSFVLALLSKPMVVTLPVIMILLDYWPLKRFESRTDNWLLWQLKEKWPLFVLSAAMLIIMFYPSAGKHTSFVGFPLESRLANAPVAFVTYLIKTFWPHNLAVFYPFDPHLPVWQAFGALLVITLMTIIVVTAIKRLPYLSVGWFWYAIAISPVIGVIQISCHAYTMADRYHYLPSIGLAVIIAWGTPDFIKSKNIRKNVLLPAGMAFLICMALIAWKQCGFWQNSFTLFSHTLRVTKNNYLAHNNVGTALNERGNHIRAIYNFNKATRLKPDSEYAYYNRGLAYLKLGQYQKAIEDYNKSLALKPNNADAYINRGISYGKLSQYELAIQDFNKAIRLKPDFEYSYYNRGLAYLKLGKYQEAIGDYNKSLELKPNNISAYINRGISYGRLDRHHQAIENFNKVILLKPDHISARQNRAHSYFNLGNIDAYCCDIKKICELGNCATLQMAQSKGLCR